VRLTHPLKSAHLPELLGALNPQYRTRGAPWEQKGHSKQKNPRVAKPHGSFGRSKLVDEVRRLAPYLAPSDESSAE